MLINNKSLDAAMRPQAGSGAGAFACAGVPAGSHAGDVVAARALPRLRWASVGSAASRQAGGGYVPTQFEQHTTLIDPVFPGGVGPHLVREREPV